MSLNIIAVLLPSLTIFGEVFVLKSLLLEAGGQGRTSTSIGGRNLVLILCKKSFKI